MILHILVEGILALATCFASSLFWQLQKRERFLKAVIRNQGYLEGFVSLDALANPSPRVVPFVQRYEVGYVFNILAVTEADKRSQRRTKLGFILLLALLFAGSYLMGFPYLVINIVLFLLLYLAPLSQSAQSNALEHVLTMAVIIYKWHIENPTECNQWIEKAWSLRPLYEAVKAAR